ncbi:MAG: bifunctional metallophosphatase/5'-nucleotidase [Gammaproteobacteria bacterium]|nr:bifunctional metallophosphatase/5'-nucleotidase [Gammaproteobacteria bacterium]
MININCKTHLFLFILFLQIFTACAAVGKPIHVTVLHFNDIYEISPVSGGKQGGLARVATLRKELLAKNPNTITVLGGDMFSPSAMGTAIVNGEKLAGKQMVDVLNKLGLDYATFGNHEFDVSEAQFKQRMKEVGFTWVSSNAFNADGKPYPGVNKSLLIPIIDPNTGKKFTIGMFGVTLTTKKTDYVVYQKPLESAKYQVNALKGKSDMIIALTHQAIADDAKMITENPDIDLVLGGHEHENYQRWRGDFTPLLKADANVRSVYVVELFFDPETGKTKIIPSLIPINDSIAEDPEIKQAVDHWEKIAFDSFRAQGFEPNKVVTVTTEALDGLEASVRSKQTNLTKLIANALLLTYPEADLSMYNGGAVRIDDIIPLGDITQYDVLRMMPFGGTVQLVGIKGSLLKKLLDKGMSSIGSGGFLQTANVEYIEHSSGNGWQIKGVLLDANKNYKVSMLDYVVSSELKNIKTNWKLINDGIRNDIRQWVIKGIKKRS